MSDEHIHDWQVLPHHSVRNVTRYYCFICGVVGWRQWHRFRKGNSPIREYVGEHHLGETVTVRTKWPKIILQEKGMRVIKHP